MTALTIVHISTQRGWHGGEEQARLLCNGLRNRGHRNVIFARRDGRFAVRMQAEGFEVYPLPGGGRGPRAIWTMRRQFRRLVPQVVHFHDPHALSGGGIATYGLSQIAKIMARRVDFPIRSTWRYRLFVDRVIAVSSAVRKICISSGIEEAKVGVVLDGVDPQRAKSGNRVRGRESLGLKEDDLLLLTVATLTDHKGHTFLLQGLPQILKSLPRKRIQLALAGDGELRDSLEAEAKQLGVESHVRFLGFRDDVPDLLKAADVFVLPSHMEGLCSTLIDVMIAETPIVSTFAGGIPDLLDRRGDEPAVAILVPPKDPLAIAVSIVSLVQQPDMARELIDAAAHRAAGNFTDDQMVEGTLAVYREVLAKQATTS